VEVGDVHSSDDVRDSTTLTERRGIALTMPPKKGRTGRLSCTAGLATPLEKVREFQRGLYRKAKSWPNFRFYALYDKVYRWAVLVEAWERVKANKGVPGIDGQWIEDIKEKGEWIFLLEIQGELETRRYHPMPARRVYIPKPNGKKRPLSIPAIKDRVVQMALKMVIEPIFEAGFEDNSYGYRPKRSGQQAAQEVRKYLNYGFNKVVEADLEDCFGSIPHKELLEMIAKRIVDGGIIRLIRMFLKAGVMEEGHIDVGERGTPQGGVVSPLFANIYLDKIDKGWKPLNVVARLIRYADDLVIITRNKDEESTKRLTMLTKSLKLKLNLEKTKVVDADKESFDFLGYSFQRKRRKKDGKVGAYCWPSVKSQRKIREKIRKVTNPKRPIKVEEVVNELNPVIRGWVNYFKIANSSKQFGKIRLYVGQKVRKFMRRRRNRRGYGFREYTNEYLYGTLGLYGNYRLSWTKAY
jgi:group II intron reverse transcriptase/maturase